MYIKINEYLNNGLIIINKPNDLELEECNKYILYMYPKTNIPKMNIGDFDALKYKNILVFWIEKASFYHEYYGSVVQYYLNTLQEEKDKKKQVCLFCELQ